MTDLDYMIAHESTPQLTSAVGRSGVLDNFMVCAVSNLDITSLYETSVA